MSSTSFGLPQAGGDFQHRLALDHFSLHLWKVSNAIDGGFIATDSQMTRAQNLWCLNCELLVRSGIADASFRWITCQGVEVLDF